MAWRILRETLFPPPFLPPNGAIGGRRVADMVAVEEVLGSGGWGTSERPSTISVEITLSPPNPKSVFESFGK